MSYHELPFGIVLNLKLKNWKTGEKWLLFTVILWGENFYDSRIKILQKYSFLRNTTKFDFSLEIFQKIWFPAILKLLVGFRSIRSWRRIKWHFLLAYSRFYAVILFKAMEQPDHMIYIVIIFSVNFCPCKIRY